MTEPQSPDKPPVPYLPILDAMLDGHSEKVDRDNVALTSQELVDQTCQFMNSFGDLIEKDECPTTLFFLLKSAAPLGYIVKKTWSALYPETPMPAIRYINIGRKDKSEYETNLTSSGELITNPFYPANHAPSVEAVRDRYKLSIKEDGPIMVIDEWSESGGTIAVAEDLIKRSFPNARVTPRVVYSQKPHWYDLPKYLGIEDADQWHAEEQALLRVNKKFGTEFRDEWEMMGDPRKPEMSKTFNEYIENFQKSPVGGIKPASDFDSEVFKASREELQIISNIVIQRAQ